MPETHLSKILHREMKRLDLNPHSMSRAAGLGKDAVRDVLRGKAVSPRGKTIRALSAYLGISIATLLGEETPEGRSGSGRLHLPSAPPGPAERDELLRLWDRLDPEAQKIAVFMMRAIAREAEAKPPKSAA